MNKREARQILSRVWGSAEVICAREVKLVESVALPGETALETVARVAEVDVRGVPAFDHYSIRNRIAEAEVYRP